MKLTVEQYRMLLHPVGEEQEALTRVYFAWKAGTGLDYLHADGDIEAVLNLAINRLEPQGDRNG